MGQRANHEAKHRESWAWHNAEVESWENATCDEKTLAYKGEHRLSEPAKYRRFVPHQNSALLDGVEEMINGEYAAIEKWVVRSVN